nr:transposase [Paralysiella testudinis]
MERNPEGRHAVVVMDGAGWHQDVSELKNISILKLPPYSPELNPIERIWRQLKQTSLSNRCYKGYGQIVEAGCAAWNALVAEKDKLCSLVACEWALL